MQMTKYRVAVTLQRSLDDQEVQQLQARRSESIATYEMESPEVVVVELHSPTSLTAVETAEIHVQRSTNVAIASTQLIP